MPGKGHRAASRQDQVRRKKKRGKAAPQVFEAAPTQSQVTRAEEADGGLPPQPQPVAVQAKRVASVRRAREPESAPGYKYLGYELRRIGLITGLILVLLGVLTVVLR